MDEGVFFTTLPVAFLGVATLIAKISCCMPLAWKAMFVHMRYQMPQPQMGIGVSFKLIYLISADLLSAQS